MKTTSYSKKINLDTWSKRTQTNPILPAPVAGKIALSAVEGPVRIAVPNLLNKILIMKRLHIIFEKLRKQKTLWLKKRNL